MADSQTSSTSHEGGVQTSSTSHEGGVTVSELQTTIFSRLSFAEKVAIKKRGRTTPDLIIQQTGTSNGKKYARSFNRIWYDRKKWLCGCAEKNALFCFPCLLFNGDGAWTKTGFTNIKLIADKAKKHEQSLRHMENVVSLSLLGTLNSTGTNQISEQSKIANVQHNIRVKGNREILSKIIDCIILCGRFEIPMIGHDDSDESLNPGILRDLIDFVCNFDQYQGSMRTNEVFKGVSKTIQNEILDCLLLTYRDKVKAEIRNASFVSIMVDDTTDISEIGQTVLVLRYVVEGEVCERFWGFFTPESQNADGIAKCILEQLDAVFGADKDKLIAQSFDGANVMKGRRSGIQTQIRKKYARANYIHCYAHHFKTVMKNAASTTRGGRIFFANLLAIPTFFLRSPQRLSVLQNHIKAKIPRPSSTRWNFARRTVERVHDNMTFLADCLVEIQSMETTDNNIKEATGILKNLNDPKFMFWLELFHRISPYVDILYNTMQSRTVSAYEIDREIDSFETGISMIRDSVYCEYDSLTISAEAKEVCDVISVELSERCAAAEHLMAANLFEKTKFDAFKVNLPKENIAIAVNQYVMLDKDALETELNVFYNRPDMHDYHTLHELLQFMRKHNLDDVLTELTKLLTILLTIPMTTVGPEGCFSTLQQAKTLLGSTMTSEKLNALAVLTIEKDFFRRSCTLKEELIDRFARTEERRTDFLYK